MNGMISQFCNRYLTFYNIVITIVFNCNCIDAETIV